MLDGSRYFAEQFKGVAETIIGGAKKLAGNSVSSWRGLRHPPLSWIKVLRIYAGVL